jgi:predicted RND superfamily exporter protein
MAYLIGGWLDRIISAQKKGVGISFIVISALMIIAFRSLRAGLWSMIPNMLPLLVLGGYVGFAWDFTDSDTFMLAMLAIGMGVDDTIHFLTRYRLELKRDDDEEKALTRTYHYAGRGIVMTTLILTIGFSPFILCQYFSLQILGTLLPMVLIVALLADLLLLPALARLRLLRF